MHRKYELFSQKQEQGLGKINNKNGLYFARTCMSVLLAYKNFPTPSLLRSKKLTWL